MINGLAQDLDYVKDMVVYGPYLTFRAFWLPDPVTGATVVQQFVQLQFEHPSGTSAKSAPEKYEQFRDRLKLAGVLHKISTKVRGHLLQQLQLSKTGTELKARAPPITPKELFDLLHESGEGFAEEVQVELQGLSQPIKSKKKREQKAA